MAEAYEAALRLVLISADLFNDSAIFRVSFHVNTPCSKSSALLPFVTALDHLFFGIFIFTGPPYWGDTLGFYLTLRSVPLWASPELTFLIPYSHPLSSQYLYSCGQSFFLISITLAKFLLDSSMASAWSG